MGKAAAIPMVVILFLGAAAPAETVHMRDGRKFVGKVTRQGEKYRIEMPYATIEVDSADVIYVLEGGTPEPLRTATQTSAPRPLVPLQPRMQWDSSRLTRPEPAVFMLTRQLELLGGDAGEGAISRQLEDWKKLLHDEKRKVNGNWIDRQEQLRRRAEFERRLAEARKLAAQLGRYTWARQGSEQAEARRIEAEAIRLLYAAASVWPDDVIQDFMAGTLDLRAKNFQGAEKRFAGCVEAQPLVAAFHQGRGMALMGLNRHLDALGEFMVCLQLRDDTHEAVTLLREAMRVTPGDKINDPAFLKAKQLLDRYESPQRSYSTYGRGLPWLMPGRPWQPRDETLVTPPYDRLVSKQALAVPLTEDTLAVDADAVAGAELIYVQAGPDLMVQAEPLRLYAYGPGKAGVPLTVLRTTGVKFTPAGIEKPAELKLEQTVTVHAANLYRQMGTEIRTATATVASAGQEGVSLSGSLLPGEGVGVVLADQAFAGFLTARCDLRQADCGKSELVKPAEVSAWAGRMTRGLASRSAPSYYNRPKLKAGLEIPPVEGRVFLVHILVGEKPPKEFGK